jgi:hypothetical protein
MRAVWRMHVGGLAARASLEAIAAILSAETSQTLYTRLQRSCAAHAAMIAGLCTMTAILEKTALTPGDRCGFVST